MTTQISELIKTWTLRISLATALIVALLSWFNGVRSFDLVIRTGLSFGILYLLFSSILMAYQKTSLPEPQLEQTSPPPERGGVIDFSVGDEVPSTDSDESLFPGQVDPSLSIGLEDSKRKADIVRRMGWE
ncbi:hypothetical protein [Desulfosporosinus sp. SB140]|uniref:hypothetical protein n=1 Tax=Desulfosporosinus paludis TaxID=3115649 RepID=UPI00388FFC5D